MDPGQRNDSLGNKDDFDTRLERFECQQCNECCKKPGFVYLVKEETERIAGFLGMEVFEFVNRYCDLQDRRRLVLKKIPNETCIFLTESGCAIHPVKPRQCLDFPVKWRTPASFEYCRGLQKINKS